MASKKKKSIKDIYVQDNGFLEVLFAEIEHIRAETDTISAPGSSVQDRAGAARSILSLNLACNCVQFGV